MANDLYELTSDFRPRAEYVHKPHAEFVPVIVVYPNGHESTVTNCSWNGFYYDDSEWHNWVGWKPVTPLKKKQIWGWSRNADGDPFITNRGHHWLWLHTGTHDEYLDTIVKGLNKLEEPE